MAPQVVEHTGQDLKMSGRRFYKMSGSGNDFVFFSLAEGSAGTLETPDAIRSLSARATGVGADGVVFLKPDTPSTFSIRYYNSDGSLGELCGNATLCSVRLAHELGLTDGGEVRIQTDAGLIHARMVDGRPQIDLSVVTEVAPELASIPRLDREERLGFVRAGVPHVVIVDEDVQTADIVGRGSSIRRDRSLKDGANVNFLSRNDWGWGIRTYERGVEGETLACGTGAVASGILLTEWGLGSEPVSLRTRSGKTLEVTVKRSADGWHPSLRGSAEIVFTGELRELMA